MAENTVSLEQSKAQERVEAISKLSRRSGDLWEFTHLARRDLTKTFGTPLETTPRVISEDAIEIGQAAGIPDEQRNRWLTELIYDQDGKWHEDTRHTSIRQYFDYFSQLGVENSARVESRVKEVLTRNPELLDFFEGLSDRSPLVGTASVLLYGQATEESPEGSASRLGWFKEAIESASKVDQEIAEPFEKLQRRAQKSNKSELTQSFLESWKDDLRLNVAEVVNLANCLAIHVQQPGQGAIQMSQVLVGIRPADFASAMSEVHALQGPEQYPDGRTPLFRRFGQATFDYLNELRPSKGEIAVPCFTSMVDIGRFLSFYQRYWKQVNSGLSTEGTYKVDNPQDQDNHYVRLGNAATIQLRGNPELRNGSQTAQARIALLGEASFRGFDIRVDRERRGLAIDIGGLKLEHALAYSRQLAQEDESAYFMESYEDIVDPHGRIKKKRSFYPSIMGAPGSVDPSTGGVINLSDGNRAAIFISLAMHEGYSVGLRQNRDYFGYHSREKIADNREFYDNFPKIVKEVKQVLTAR